MAKVDGDACRGVVSKQALAVGVPVGKRIPSVKVLNQSDARPWHLQELLPSNGRWRVIVLPGDVTDSGRKQALDKLGAEFEQKDSFYHRFTPSGKPHDEVFELMVVHHAPRQRVTIFDFPSVFRHFDEIEGWDYNKIFADDVSYHEGDGKLYETFGIHEDGCVVIVRPDQYVSYVGPLSEPGAVTKFFSGFMKQQY